MDTERKTKIEFEILPIPGKTFEPDIIDLVGNTTGKSDNIMEIPSKDKISDLITKNPLYRTFFEAKDNGIIKIRTLDEIKSDNVGYTDKLLIQTFSITLLNFYKEIFGLKGHLTRSYNKNIEVALGDELEIKTDGLYKEGVKIYDFNIINEKSGDLKGITKV
ncbi:hypothetical protein EOM39_02295 [Candidatus Gracilibacteria bacterium]|nr:hypothetical protein [Candidatus Gracilibacteria bacterium]